MQLPWEQKKVTAMLSLRWEKSPAMCRIQHFLRKKSYLEAHPDTVQAFVNALQRGMEKVSQSTPEEIAKMIALQFPETDEAVLTAIVRRYVEQDTWKTDLIFSEDAFILLQDILEEGGELTNRVAYEELVNTEFAKKGAFWSKKKAEKSFRFLLMKKCALQCSAKNPVAGYPSAPAGLTVRIGFGSFCHSGKTSSHYRNLGTVDLIGSGSACFSAISR